MTELSASTIKRLLIANRGEIAVRVARTAHELGLSTVGIYAEPDVGAVHVDAVDSAVSVPTYLDAEAVIAAAKQTGCDAVHPGYGFLAENADFARSVIDAGLIWVGPTPEQIALLGDKVAAKTAAIEAGVPTTDIIEVAPGSIPDDVPMPALVKAAAGGGGRGMRVVRSADDLAAAVEAAAREAEAAFGDPSVFIEPYIERGRHVEVQIIGDRHGAVIHLGERECSIQRRNQKVIEESPSAGIDDATRAALLDGAIALATHVGYENAGTVEFLVGEPDHPGGPSAITFLEVNTRLQVEHPVTEAVTGLDLVALQLLVASGEPLPIGQDDVRIDGHAIEVRVVAEDPAADWLPSTGAISTFDLDRPGVRVDAGFTAGSTVSSEYDSLLAKVISHEPTRVQAAGVLARALRPSMISGVRTNIDSLVAILEDDDFLAAATPTAYLAEHPDLLAPSLTDDEQLPLLLAAVFAAESAARRAAPVLGFSPSGWRNLRTQGQRVEWLDAAGDTHQVEYELEPANGPAGPTEVAAVRIGPWPEPTEDGTLSADERRIACVRLLRRSADEQVLEIDGRRTVVTTSIDGEPGSGSCSVDTSSAAGSASWQQPPRFVDHEATAGGGGPICPLPGTVIAVHVEAGQTVDEGQLLMVVEAMKMEHSIKAASASVVTDVHFAVGDRVDAGDLLVSLQDAEGDEASDD